MDAVTMIAVHDARSACAGKPTLEARVKAAMQATHDHYLQTSLHLQLQAALAGAYLETTDEAERDLLGRSSRAMNKATATLQALLSGVALGLEKIEPLDEDILPLGEWWRETK